MSAPSERELPEERPVRGADAEQAKHSGHAPPAFDSRQYRNALGRFASGVTIVTTRDSERTHGMTANAFVSVSLNPPLILISVDNRAAMNLILPVTRYFGISVLAEHQEKLSNHFAGRTTEGLHVPFVDRRDVPVIEGAVAHFVARVIDVHPAGDHTLYVGHVDHFECRDEERPLLFFAGRYHQLKADHAKPGVHPEDEMALFTIGALDPPVG